MKPKLRFSNFINDYEIKDVSDITSNISSGKISKQLEDGEYNVYGSMGIIGKSNFYDYAGEKVLVARVGANAGSVNKINEKCCISDNTLVLEPKDILNDYLYYALSHYNPKKLIFGSGQPLVTGGQLKKIKLGIPSKVEQLKVSNFLSLLDKKIELQSKKIEDLKLFKMSTLDKYFNKDTCKEKALLKKYCSCLTGKSKADKVDINGKYYIMDMGTVNSDGNILKTKPTFCNLDLLSYGDLVMPKDDIGGGLIIGKTGFIDEDNKYVLGDHVYLLKVNDINSLFLHYQINSKYINKQLKRKVTGSAQLGLKSDNILNQEIYIYSEEEQKKIANIFKLIDRKIELETEKIFKLINLKKGLMQNMFV